jgi:hypothetical protein
VTIDYDVHRVATVDVFLFATEKWVDQYQVGVGEDVFMMGLFIDNEVPSHNVPMARFGNISLMPSDSAPIMQPHGVKNGSFVLDMHSRAGFSGSPVFMYRTLGSDLEFKPDLKGLSTEALFKFIGIHWGQFAETFKVHRGDKVREYKIEGMSGMSCAIPAWRIRTLLDTHPVIVEQRRAREAAQRKDPATHAYAWPMSSDKEYDPYEGPIQ